MNFKFEKKYFARWVLPALLLSAAPMSGYAQYYSDQALNEKPVLVGMGGQITASSDEFSYEKLGPNELGLALPGATETLKAGATIDLKGELIYVGGTPFQVPGQKLPAQRVLSHASDSEQAPSILERE